MINPCFSVIADNYTFLRDASSALVLTTKREVPSETEEKLRRLVLGVGSIRPRRVFAAGVTLRGLQLHTPLRRIFDPPAHFGATINLLALFDGIAWPGSFTLGYAISEAWWNLGAPFDASRREGTAPAPAPESGSAANGGDALAEAPWWKRWRTSHPPPPPHSPRVKQTPWWNRGGLRLQLHLPAVHVSGITLTLLLATHQWRWVVLWASAAVSWSGIHADGSEPFGA